MEKNLKIRKVVIEDVLTATGAGLYVASNFESKKEIVEFLEEFLNSIKPENSTTTIIQAHIN